MNDDWRGALREARRNAGLSMQALARESGLSYEAVRGYENGRRSPTRDSMLKLLRALRLSAVHANLILEGAGLASESALFGPDPQRTAAFRVDELQKVIDRRPWPTVATDDAMRVVAANRAFQALWGFDFAKERMRRKPWEMHMLVIGGDLKILPRITNWSSSFSAAASLNKGTPAGASPDERAAEMLQAIRAAARGDERQVESMLKIWQQARAAPPKLQADFPIVWRDPDFGEMRFRSVMTIASQRDLLHFRDWHPVDAATWEALEKVKQRWARARRRKRRV